MLHSLAIQSVPYSYELFVNTQTSTEVLASLGGKKRVLTRK